MISLQKDRKQGGKDSLCQSKVKKKERNLTIHCMLLYDLFTAWIANN